MTQENIYTIGQLALAAGVTPRTIRYYTAEGLLTSPDTRGRYARYSEAHLHRLRLIGAWKQAYLPLHAIKAKLETLAEADLESLANGVGDNASNPLETAPPSRPTQSMPEASAPPEPMDDPAAMILQLLGPQGAGPDRSESLPMVLPRRRRVLLISPLIAGPDDRLDLSRDPDGSDPTFILENSLSETWKRIALAPGVELHVRLPQTPEGYDHLDRMIAETKALFKSLQ